MGHMSRLLTLLSAASMLLGVAACVLWWRSHHVADPARAAVWISRDQGRVTAHSAGGRVTFFAPPPAALRPAGKTGPTAGELALRMRNAEVRWQRARTRCADLVADGILDLREL